MSGKGRLRTPRRERIRRSRMARALIALLGLGLGAALFRLQVLQSDELVLTARSYRLRAVSVPAPRGTIYDRHGHVVAANRPGYEVLLMPAPPDSMAVRLARLRPVLGLTDAGVRRAMRSWQGQQHLPMTVLQAADPFGVARLVERRAEFPDVLLHEHALRYYPDGEDVAHIVGYVAEISDRELKELFPDYEQGRWIGKNGLEKQYERVLGGKPGVRYLEMDAQGRIVRWLPEELGVPPVPGRDLRLHLDLDLQRFIAAIFPKEYNGAIVALDPATGGVLAYYSHPTFDPNRFTGGIPAAYWTVLQEDPRKPLVDRVAGSAQPAASTWKLAVAGMALHLGVIDPEERLPCTGGVSYGGRYARCWYAPGHGPQDLVSAIRNSCNAYFYQLGIRIGFERFLSTGTRLGFATMTGIDLPTEIANSFPDSPDW